MHLKWWGDGLEDETERKQQSILFRIISFLFNNKHEKKSARRDNLRPKNGY